MKTAISKTQFVAAAVIASAFAVGFMSGPAFADDKRKEEFGFQFAFEPTEFATSDSAAKLLTRLESKVKKFCSANAVQTGSRMKKPDMECITKTMDQTVASFNSATVAEVYKNKGRADG